MGVLLTVSLRGDNDQLELFAWLWRLFSALSSELLQINS